MAKDYSNFLKDRLDQEAFNKLTALENSKVIDFVGEYVELCSPESVFVRTDTVQDSNYIREKAKTLSERKVCESKAIQFTLTALLTKPVTKRIPSILSLGT